MANLKRPGDDIGDLSSRLFLSVQLPSLIGLAAEVSLAVRLLNCSSTVRCVPRNDRSPGGRQNGQCMVRQTATRRRWTCGRKSPSKQMLKARQLVPVTGMARREVGKVGSTSGGTIGILRLTWWENSILGKNCQAGFKWFLSYRLLLWSCIARQLIRQR